MSPNIAIAESVVRNALAKLRFNEDDASKFVSILREQRRKGIIEYLKVSLNNKSGVLTSAIWSYQRSCETAARCGDFLYWDSIHNTTKCLYKLSTFTVVDSESSSRAVLFRLALRETAEECKAMLFAWHLAFNSRLPKVIFSDGDEAINVAISSLLYAS